MGWLGKTGLSTRREILGVPVGRERPDWTRIAMAGAGLAAMLAGGRQARHAAGKGSGEDDGNPSSVEDLVSKGQEALSKPSQLMQAGTEAAETVSSVGDQISRVQQAVGQETSTFGKFRAAVQALGDEDESEGGEEKKQRLIIQEQIDVAAPRDFVYEQWKEFGEFHSIFRAVQQVELEDEETEEENGDESGDEEDDGEVTTRWQAKILVSKRQWESEITDDVAGRRIAWNSTGDVDHTGAVSFHQLAEHLTRVHLEMEYHPTGFVEKFGNLFLTVRHRVRKDLRLFKHFVELQETPWSDAREQESEDGGEASEKTEEKTEEKSEEKGSSDGRKRSSGGGGSRSGQGARKKARKKATKKQSSGSRKRSTSPR